MNDSKAMEAAAVAFRSDYFGSDSALNSETVAAIQRAARAAVRAYLAQREADGFVMVHLGELERAGVILTPRA